MTSFSRADLMMSIGSLGMNVVNMVGTLSFLLQFLPFIFCFSAANGVGNCSTDNGRIFSAWSWKLPGNKPGHVYHLNLCKQADGCPAGVSVCNTAEKYGNTVKAGTKIPTQNHGSRFSITFNHTTTKDPKCPKRQATIFFGCEKNLGFPEIVQETECLLVIEFNTNEACSKFKRGTKEIPCSIYDPVSNSIRDLSPLIKQNGGHLVATSARGVDIWINVCRDITNTDKLPASSCPKGSSSCRTDTKSTIGQITDNSKLKYEDGKIKLFYFAPKLSTGCKKKSTTNITFVCPENFREGGNGPVLVSSPSTCQYEIEWRTDHACKNNDELTKECTYSKGDVTFDLKKLEKPEKGESYGVDTTEYTYRLKVCSNGQACGAWDVDGSKTAICQISKKTVNDASCGDANYRTIRYADGNLTLTYKNGKPCHTGINRTSVIIFRCDPTVDVGGPAFLGELEHCYYYFDWPTRHVCPSRKPGTCSITQMSKTSRQTYDLSVLTKTGTNWLALNTRKDAADYLYYINVCGDVTTKHKECDGAAVCEVSLSTGKAKNIGVFRSLPTILSPNTLQLNYTGGTCEKGRTTVTIIKFLCKFENFESPPELESRSWDGCLYRFIWRTAAACSLEVINGKNCTLENKVTGDVFNLTALKNGPGGESNFFTVPAGKSKTIFKIKVCGNLDDGSCGKKTNVGACQVPSKDGPFSTGQGNSNLYYYDGKVNLTYTGGDKCSLYDHPPRTTHITFFCNETAGHGKPVYEKENYCTYHFLWYTSLVCPQKTIECLVKDSQGKEYDLTSLVKTDGNWITKKGSSTYYINVCRALYRTKETKGCPTNSAVCLNGKTSIGEVSNVSLSFSNVDGNNGIVLNYPTTGGCGTQINFICVTSGSDRGPQFVPSTGCSYKFEWSTPSACAVKPRAIPGCSATSNTGKTVDISALTNKQGYSVKGPSYTITFNVCKNITCGKDKSSTVCLIPDDKTKKPYSLGRSISSTIEHHGDIIVLTYPLGRRISKPEWSNYATTVIYFICARNVTKPKPVFRGQEKNVYTIDFRTSVACPDYAVECVVFNKSQKYDLSPLGLASGNWMAADTRGHLDYYINICKHYNPGGLSPSCSGSVGGCQVDRKNPLKPIAHSMGIIKHTPFLSARGDLTLRYVGGGLCHKRFQRSTRINFFCSKIHASPVYMVETEECEYVFSWKTPSACPLEKKTGKNCTVYDDQYGVLYDLRKLKDQSHNVPLSDGSTLHLGFCEGHLTNCPKGAVACKVKKGEKPISFTSDRDITFEEDTVTLKYTSKDVEEKSKWVITNNIACSKEAGLLKLSSSLVEGHKIVVEWSSNLACRPVSGEECTLTHDGELYDLSVLAKKDWNWQARVANYGKDQDYSKNKFYLSVCKPLANLPGLKRNDSRAAIDKSGAVKSLGTMDRPLYVRSGYLTMSYGLLHDSKYSNPATHIQFVCDNVPEGRAGEPVLDLYDEENCIAHFTWITKAACPVRNMITQKSTACTAVHPATMKVIDLNKLGGRYTLEDQDGNKYTLGICKAIKGCSGMCQVVTGKSVGKLNTTLVYRQGFLYLTYKDGDVCKDLPPYKMETLISFICDRSVTGNGYPVLERTTKCTHYVTWRTPLACEAEVECVVSDGKNFYDLSPLIKNNGNYEVYHGDKRYLINVCRSLARETICSSGAAVCAVDIVSRNGKFLSSDLGHADGVPTIITDENKRRSGAKVQLVYNNGDPCGTKGGKKSTTIEFVCDSHETLGHPLIIPSVDKTGCSLTVQWRTSLVCERKPVSNSNCTFFDHSMRFCFDLTKLQGHTSKKISRAGVTIHFDICGSGKEFVKELKDCGGADGCIIEKDQTITPFKKRMIKYSGREVQLDYGNVLIIIYCGKDQGDGPQYLGQDKKSKKYVFNLISTSVCPPRELSCIVEDGNKVYDLGVLTKQSKPWSIAYEGDRYLVNICGNIPLQQPSMCSSRVTALRHTSAGKQYIIGEDTEQKLLFKRGDKYPIQLTYSSSEKVKDCKSGKPTVIHKMKCANVNYPPYLERFDKTNCVFYFVWRTHGACAEQRVPMKRTGPWTFSDPRSAHCDLDLGILKNKIQALHGTSGCKLGEPTLYSEGEFYELYVTCSRYKLDINLRCFQDAKEGNLTVADNYTSQLTLEWETAVVCDQVRLRSCDKSGLSRGGKAAIAVIGTFTAIGILAAVIFFAWKPEKRESAALWIRWHVRKYICCKPSYQASYRYRKVNSEDGETDFIIETNAQSLFSDDDDEEDGDGGDSQDEDDDELLPLDDDLLNLND